MKKIAKLLQVLLLVILPSTSASAVTVPERLVYEVKWSGIKAGTAVLEAVPHEEGVRIVNTIRSTGFVSAFFRIDDRSESVVSKEGMPVSFSENVNEGRFKARREVSFDFASLNADTRDLLSKGEKRDRITSRTYDNLSSIFFIRSGRLVEGETIAFDLYDSKKLWNARVRVVKRQELSTPLGKFKTVMVTSQLSRDGVPARVGNATFWFTDDSRRIPVRIDTRLKVGEVTLMLTAKSP